MIVDRITPIYAYVITQQHVVAGQVIDRSTYSRLLRRTEGRQIRQVDRLFFLREEGTAEKACFKLTNLTHGISAPITVRELKQLAALKSGKKLR